jgi:Ni2+-binding GTPase involved in maturation of urease and hydrogenase
MLYAFGADEHIGDLLHSGSFAADDQNLEAMIMVEVDVQSGENVVVKIVLEIGELLTQQADVVVIDKSDSADNRAVRMFRDRIDEFGADEVAERFGAVAIATAGDQTIEFAKQVGVDGYANSAKLAHGRGL